MSLASNGVSVGQGVAIGIIRANRAKVHGGLLVMKMKE